MTAATGGNYTLTPSAAGYTFSPASLPLNNLNADQTANFSGVPLNYTISGLVTGPGANPVSGVTILPYCSYSPASPTTDSSGNYSFSAPAFGFCNVTPVLGDYTFNPNYYSVGFMYGNMTVNFEAIPPDSSDFNYSGNPDVVWQNPLTGAAQIWYLGGPQGATVTGAYDLTTSNPWRIVGIADFNMDGTPDIVWQDPVSGAVQLWLLQTPPNGTGLAVMQAIDLAGSNSWRVVSVADFNRDGTPDLLWQDPESGAAQIWYLQPNFYNIMGAVDLTKANPWRVVGAGDFNGDGFTDILWQDPHSGTVQVWYMGGTTAGAIGSQVQSAADLTSNPWKAVAIADFNLDGHPGLVFQDSASGAAQIYYYTGSQGTTYLGNATLSGPNPWYIAGPH